jgi:hypothetical protein
MNLRHPFVWISESIQKRAFIGIFIFTLAAMMAMNIIGQPLVNETAPQGIVSFEFAGTIESAQRMMDSWGAQGRVSAGLSLGFDYLFLIVYAACISLGCVLVARALHVRIIILASIGSLLAWAQFLAAMLDAMENYALIRVLLGSNQNMWPAIARICAGPKFLIVLTGLLYIICGLILIFIIKESGYLERTSCIGCGSGFQPRSFNFAAGSRSHKGFFMVTWTFRISALKKKEPA